MSSQQLIEGPVFIFPKIKFFSVDIFLGRRYVFVPVMSVVKIDGEKVVVLGPEPHSQKVIHRGFVTGMTNGDSSRKIEHEFPLSEVLKVEDRDGKILWQQ